MVLHHQSIKTQDMMGYDMMGYHVLQVSSLKLVKFHFQAARFGLGLVPLSLPSTLLQLEPWSGACDVSQTIFAV